LACQGAGTVPARSHRAPGQTAAPSQCVWRQRELAQWPAAPASQRQRRL